MLVQEMASIIVEAGSGNDLLMLVSWIHLDDKASP